MSSAGLTMAATAPKPGSASSNKDVIRISGSEANDSSREQSPSTSKPPSDNLFGVYRGIKRTTPSREDGTRQDTQPQLSQLALKSTAQTAEKGVASAPLPSGRNLSAAFPPRPSHHARSLSLQDSLAKPLPQPPPPQLSPPTPLTPLANPAQGSLAGLLSTTAMDSRTSTMDSTSSAEMYNAGPNAYASDAGMTGSQSSLLSASRPDGGEEARDNLTPRSNGPVSSGPSPQAGQSRTSGGAAPVGTPAATPSSSHLSGLMCNVHRTTGREPHPLVGATTTIVGDKLYVFGGRILSRSRPAPLTSDLYELDLIRRHWTKLETSGDTPPPRYFHSMCALGDTKMVCYGGMSPTQNQTSSNTAAQDQQPEVTVMSDIYVYDVPTRHWTYIPTQDAPQGRYAHCACILASSAAFSSHKAPLSALQHNPSTGNPNEGRIGISIDGTGGAEMVVVGGQDGANHYIEQISVFNLRSLKWTSTQSLGKSCGAYRSVVAPLSPAVNARLGKPSAASGPQRPEGGISQEAREPGSSMLIYSNYNFLDVKLELQIRASDGTLTEKPMSGSHTPPGLRFPNGGVIDAYFIVSGTYLTSSKQEYALWALDLKTLTWGRIDAGGNVFSQGSWNRGVLWNRRNTFVVLGNRKRSLVDDYNHRRINFSNVCMVELEAFGFYDNPRKTAPMSGFVSASSPYAGPGLSIARKAGVTAGGRFHSRASEELGEKALAMRELSDMDILCIGGERVPINSRVVARRWGPYFVQLLREGTATQDGSDVLTLRSGAGSISGHSGLRTASMATITMSRDSIMSAATTLTANSGQKPPSTASTAVSNSSALSGTAALEPVSINTAPTPRSLAPNSRPRCLYLPHTYLTIQALLHYLYTSSLPPTTSPLCTPQILCSLLQIARPYRIDGLLEAVVEKLHGLLDSRNAAAVFNATAMAAGGGRGIDGTLNPNFFPLGGVDELAAPDKAAESYAAAGASAPGSVAAGSANGSSANGSSSNLAAQTANLRIHTAVSDAAARPDSEELSATASASGSEWSSELGDGERGSGSGSGSGAAPREIWAGELSSVIGLQKRGLRGLMEGRKMRERAGTGPNQGGMAAGGGAAAEAGAGGGGVAGQVPTPRVGLGIAGGA